MLPPWLMDRQSGLQSLFRWFLLRRVGFLCFAGRCFAGLCFAGLCFALLCFAGLVTCMSMYMHTALLAQKDES